MSSRSARVRSSLYAVSFALAGALSFGCVVVGAPDKGGGSGAPGADGGGSGPPPGGSSDLFSRVGITALPGASAAAGLDGVWKTHDLGPGSGQAPALTNSVLSALPGAPPKPLFVGQTAPFDKVLVAVQGQHGYFAVPANQNQVVALDLVTLPTAAVGKVTLQVATKTNDTI